MLSSAKILALIEQIGSPGSPGAVEAARRFGLARLNDRNAGGYESRAQADLLTAIQRTPSRPRPPAYLHPASAPEAGANYKHEPLSPADLMWLERLPRDPAAVTFDDAVILAKFAATYGAAPRQGSVAPPADRRLIASIWEPVRTFHDRNQAEADLKRAKVPLPEVPSSALGALADAIAAEVPDLTADEALGRASAALRDALDQRLQTQQAELAKATTTLADIDGSATERATVTRTEMFDQDELLALLTPPAAPTPEQRIAFTI